MLRNLSRIHRWWPLKALSRLLRKQTGFSWNEERFSPERFFFHGFHHQNDRTVRNARSPRGSLCFNGIVSQFYSKPARFSARYRRKSADFPPFIRPVLSHDISLTASISNGITWNFRSTTRFHGKMTVSDNPTILVVKMMGNFPFLKKNAHHELCQPRMR